jgi:hypothetical protein
MREFTTNAWTKSRDQVPAEQHGHVLDTELETHLDQERRRTMGKQLSSGLLRLDDHAVLDASANDINDACQP